MGRLARLLRWLFRRNDEGSFDRERDTFRRDANRELRGWTFQLFALLLLIALVVFSARILLECSPCPEQSTGNLAAVITHLGQATTQPAEADARRRVAEQLLRERDAAVRSDGENRAWARTFLTTVAGAIIGFLFGTSPPTATQPPRTRPEEPPVAPAPVPAVPIAASTTAMPAGDLGVRQINP